MSRRSRGWGRSTRQRKVKTAFGEHMDAAKNRIQQLCMNVALATCPLKVAPDDLLTFTVKPEAVGALRAVKPFIPKSFYPDIVGVTLPMYRQVALRYPISDFAANPRDDLVEWQDSDASTKFLERCEKVVGIVQRFAIVQNVVEWFNEHSTRAAIRFYFPQAMSLMPGVDWGDGSKYTAPSGIGAMSAQIREATQVLATGQMAPEAKILGKKAYLEFSPSFTFNHPQFGPIHYIDIDVPVDLGTVEDEDD